MTAILIAHFCDSLRAYLSAKGVDGLPRLTQAIRSAAGRCPAALPPRPVKDLLYPFPRGEVTKRPTWLLTQMMSSGPSGAALEPPRKKGEGLRVH